MKSFGELAGFEFLLSSLSDCDLSINGSEMEEAKTLMQLGPFGVIALSILIFISCTICLCLTIHVKFIWTFLCPLQSLLTCCRLFANKFRASHKATPKSILDLERRTLGSKRALKIARRVNQSCELKDFHHISLG